MCSLLGYRTTEESMATLGPIYLTKSLSHDISRAISVSSSGYNTFFAGTTPHARRTSWDGEVLHGTYNGFPFAQYSWWRRMFAFHAADDAMLASCASS